MFGLCISIREFTIYNISAKNSFLAAELPLSNYIVEHVHCNEIGANYNHLPSDIVS